MNGKINSKEIKPPRQKYGVEEEKLIERRIPKFNAALNQGRN